MTIDVLYLAYNRLAFTELSFGMLIDNTDWSLVRKLHVMDDGSSDGTYELLVDMAEDVPVKTTVHPCAFRSPVATMLHYLDDHAAGANAFAKLDNDIVAPPGWLTDLRFVMQENPTLELLGMGTGFSGLYEGPRTYNPATHIGGVGLMRVSAFESRPRMVPNGRFGFTEWQHQRHPRRAWIAPDLLVCELDQVPDEPWASLSDTYTEKGWQRRWPRYGEDKAPYWRWWGDTPAR